MGNIGKEVLLIKPSPEMPRNTEGAFALLNDGTIMFAYSRFIGGCGDNSEAEIYAIFSYDDGETWGDGRTLVQKRPEDVNIMSVSFLRMKDGSLGLFYLRKTVIDDEMNCRPNFMRSYDEGKTWTEPKCCIESNGYYIVNNDRIVRLKSGRVIIPASFHPKCADRAESCFFISDDDCETFREAKQHLHLPFMHNFTGMQETGICELKDGRLWAWARTGHGYQFEAYSEDEGETWSDVRPNEFFTSPNSPMSAKWIQNEKILAIFNPIPFYNGRFPVGVSTATHADSVPVHLNVYHPFSVYEGRTPLVCSLTSGTPKEFELELRTIEDNPELGFCYPAIFPHKDFVLVAYFIIGDKYGYSDTDLILFGIRIKKIALDELTS